MASTAEKLSNFIDGQPAAWDGESEPVLNPATGEEIATAPRSGPREVDRAVSAARQAFEGWSNATPADRSRAHDAHFHASAPELTQHLPPTLPGHYFSTRGGSLGVGFPGAMGLKLALPDKTVIGFSGDGGAMYTIQAMWTAARHGIAVSQYAL